MRGGRTVEVLNTDAEGRLVMADALVDASRTHPDLLLDVATLTGAQVVALGQRVSAAMANDDALRDADRARRGRGRGAVLADAAAAGAALQHWTPRSPTSPTSASAWAACSSPGSSSPSSSGPRRRRPIPWAHLDIAGPAFNTGSPHGYTPAGGTGVPVRTLLRLLEDVAAHGA